MKRCPGLVTCNIMFRHLLITTVLALAFCQGGFSQTTQTANGGRPNIIFLLSDDQRWDSLGIMGNTVVQTPNLDKLADAGILFRNGYVTTSICCISRASILTGQYESRHDIRNFTKSFSPEQVAQTYPSLLRKAGYKTGFIGKYGVGKKEPSDTFDFWACTDKGQPPYITTDENGQPIHNTDLCSRDIDRFLDKFGKGDQPFCLSVSFKAPHELDGHPPELVVQDRFKDLYKDVKIPLPVTAAPQYWENLPDFFHSDKNIARQRWQDLFSTPELYQENVKNYYRLITGLDEAVGKLVAHLKELNLDSNTAIIFMGDNGFFLGEHGLEGKWFGYEESIRVPLFIYYPGLPDALRDTEPGQIALNIDVAPTILGLANVEAPGKMQGIDLIAMLEGKVPARDDFFYEHDFQKTPALPQSESVVSVDWKYLKYTEHNYEELFNLALDPHETKNLAKDPASQAKLEEMRARYEVLKKQAK